MTPPIITNSTEGTVLSIAGGSYRIIVPGSQTNGEFAVIEMTVPPGAGPNPHAHPLFTETFYVLEGEVTVKSEAGKQTAKHGTFITVPKGGVIHGFKNLSDTPAKLLCTVMPAGLDDFFLEMSQLPIDAENKMEKIKAISEKYGQTLYPPDYLGE